MIIQPNKNAKLAVTKNVKEPPIVEKSKQTETKCLEPEPKVTFAPVVVEQHEDSSPDDEILKKRAEFMKKMQKGTATKLPT